MKEISEWLEGQAELGEIDSQGEFTLDPEAAWKKLGAKGLPRDFAWVGKLVQAANRSGVSLDLKQSRDESVFEFGVGPAWTHEQVSETVFRPFRNKDDALGHFAVAVRTLVASAFGFRFWLQYPDGTRATWSGERFELSQPRRGGILPLSLGVSCHLSSQEEIRQPFVVRADISKELHSLAQWSPRPIRIDSREISNILEDPKFSSSQSRQPLCLITAPTREDQVRLKLRARFTPRGSSTSVNAQPLDAHLRKAIKELADGVFAVGLVTHFLPTESSSSRPASEFVWVCDGVEVMREPLPIKMDSMAILIACSAEGLKTDVTGLTLRQSKSKEARKREALGAIVQCYPDTTDDEDDFKITSQTVKGVEVVVAALAFAVSPFLGMFLTAGAAWWARAKAENNKEIIASIKSEFHALKVALVKLAI